MQEMCGKFARGRSVCTKKSCDKRNCTLLAFGLRLVYITFPVQWLSLTC